MTACPKPRPHALVKRNKAAALAKLDRAENAKVKRRSEGCCERRIGVSIRNVGDLDVRCFGRATEIHHLCGGSGRRNRGDSILARWKLHICHLCHRGITEHSFVPLNPQADALSIVYERRR